MGSSFQYFHPHRRTARAASAESARHTSQEGTPRLSCFSCFPCFLLLEFASLPTGLENRTFSKVAVCLRAACPAAPPRPSAMDAGTAKHAPRSVAGIPRRLPRGSRFSSLLAFRAPVCSVGCQTETNAVDRANTALPRRPPPFCPDTPPLPPPLTIIATS